MADAKQAWEQVVEGFTELGRALRERVAEATGGTTDSGAAAEPAASETADATGTAAGQEGGHEREDTRAVADALNAFADAARRLGETAGAAVTDPALRDTAVRVADRLGTALAATVDEIGDNLRTFADARRNQRSQSAEGPWAEAADDAAQDADAESAPTVSDDDPRAGGA